MLDTFTPHQVIQCCSRSALQHWQVKHFPRHLESSLVSEDNFGVPCLSFFFFFPGGKVGILKKSRNYLVQIHCLQLTVCYRSPLSLDSPESLSQKHIEEGQKGPWLVLPLPRRSSRQEEDSWVGQASNIMVLLCGFIGQLTFITW